VLDNKNVIYAENSAGIPDGFGDPQVTRTGFRPDPYTGTVFAGPGMGKPKRTRRCTRVHPYPFGPCYGRFAISRKLFSHWMPVALEVASHNLLKVQNTMNLGSTHGEIYIS
jgi:hypothetical protein